MNAPQAALPPRPSFAALVLTDLIVWVTVPIVLALVVAAPFLRSQGIQTEIVFSCVGALMLAIAGWRVYVWSVLSARGIVAPGVLIAEDIESGRSTTYKATYGFDVGVQRFSCSHTYSHRGSVRSNVWLLFDSQKPQRAQVIPAILRSR